ncbi:MAG: NHL repeat-containing protein [Verrucomicrobiota bacterium]
MRNFSLTLTILFGSLSLAPIPVEAGKRWTIDPDAKRVIGQVNFESNVEGNGQSGLANPTDVAADPTTGKIFVIDSTLNRVLRYPSFAVLANGGPAEAVVGQPDFETYAANTTDRGLIFPPAITVDATGRLWVVDGANNRVLWFDNASQLDNEPVADGVLGQDGFGTMDSGTLADRFNAPNGIAVDASGNVFVGDTGNSRVLVFFANALANGVDASRVLGQEDFTSPGVATDQDGMMAPRGVAVDSAGNLFVADNGNHRVLRFDAAAGKDSGADADAVLGQSTFDTRQAGAGPSGMWSPWDVIVDSSGRLWVAEFSGKRVIGFTSAASLGNGADADLVLAQMDFLSRVEGLTASRVGIPDGLGTDASGRVYVTDSVNNRVLVFEPDAHFPDLTIGGKLSSLVGENVYDASGASQSRTVRSGKKKIKLVGFLGNDGNLPDQYQVAGAGSNRKFAVKLFWVSGGRANVSAAVKAGAFVTNPFPAGSVSQFEWLVKPKSSIRAKRGNYNAWWLASSVTDGEADRATGKVRYRP